jgi:hypothetical protein
MNALGTAITALATLTIVGCGGGGEPSLPRSNESPSASCGPTR